METILLTSIDKQDSNSEDTSEKILTSDIIKKPTDPGFNMKNNFEQFINDLRENMNKCKFRKCLEDIRDKEGLFYEYDENWKIKELKIRCMLKIINKKFSKYSGNSKIKGLDEWFRRVDDEINKWFEILLNFDKNFEVDQFIAQLEICIKVVLEQCYNYALQSRNDKHIADCAAYLGLGERLIKYSYKFTNDPDCLNITQKILLFISSLLIADNDFETAMVYQENALKLSYRELNFRIGNEGEINTKNITKTEKFYLEKVFLNITIAFYQRGVCEENIGNIVKAIEAYKQSKWFSFNFTKQNLPELTQFLFDVEKRAFNYHNLIQNVKKNQDNYKDHSEKNRKNSKPKLFYNEFDVLKKFEKTIDCIEHLKIDEIEENDSRNKKSTAIMNLMSTTNMINHLMSEKFRGIIKSLNKIEITKLDKDTKEIIQKKLNEIKSEKVYLEKENFWKNYNTSLEINDSSNNTKNLQNINIPYIKTESSVTPSARANDQFRKSFPFNSCTSKPKLNQSTNESNPVKIITSTQASERSELHQKKLNKDLFDFSNKRVISAVIHSNNQSARPHSSFTPLKTFSNYKSTRAASSMRKKEEVEKLKYSDYIFNKNFRKKMDFLDNFSNREFKFQKKILTMKKDEKLYIEQFDKKKVIEDCESYFNKTLKSKAKALKNDNESNKKKEILNEENEKQDRVKEKLEIRAIKSLNHKAFDDYSKFNKNTNKPRFTLRKEFKSEIINKLPDKTKIDQINKEHINKIEAEIEKLNKLEDSYYRDIHPYSTPNQENSKKSFYNMTNTIDSFIKK